MVVSYCGDGGAVSRRAHLSQSGFSDVRNLEGGLRSWSCWSGRSKRKTKSSDERRSEKQACADDLRNWVLTAGKGDDLEAERDLGDAESFNPLITVAVRRTVTSRRCRAAPGFACIC